MITTFGVTTGVAGCNPLLLQGFSAASAVGMDAAAVSITAVPAADSFVIADPVRPSTSSGRTSEAIPLGKITPLAFKAAVFGALYLLGQTIDANDTGISGMASPMIVGSILDLEQVIKAINAVVVWWKVKFSKLDDLVNEARGDQLSTLALVKRAKTDQAALSALIGTAGGSKQVAKTWAAKDSELIDKIVAGKITEDVVYKLDLLMNIGGEAADTAIAKVIESQGAANIVHELVTRGIAPAKTLVRLLDKGLLAKELAESVAKGDNPQSINFARQYLLEGGVSKYERGKRALFTALANEASTSFRVFSLLMGICIREAAENNDCTFVYDAFRAIDITRWAERLNQGGENLADAADAKAVFNFLLSINHTGTWDHMLTGCEKGDDIAIDLVSPLAEQGDQRAMDALVKSGQTERIASVVARGQKQALEALTESARTESKGVDALAYLITNDLYPDALEKLAEIVRVEEDNTAALDKLIEFAEKRDDALEKLIGLMVIAVQVNEPHNFSMMTVGRINNRVDKRSPGLTEKIKEKLWSAAKS